MAAVAVMAFDLAGYPLPDGTVVGGGSPGTLRQHAGWIDFPAHLRCKRRVATDQSLTAELAPSFGTVRHQDRPLQRTPPLPFSPYQRRDQG